MATEFHLPDIGEGLIEAVIVSWYCTVGEEVAMDAPLVEVERRTVGEWSVLVLTQTQLLPI